VFSFYTAFYLFYTDWAKLEPTPKSVTEFINLWFKEVEKSNIQPFMQFAKTVKAHLSGIINLVETRITNAILESINNKIQHAKRRARGQWH